MYCYDIGGHLAASLLPGLPLEPAQLPACGFPPLFLLDRDPHIGRAAWRATDPRQLTAPREGAAWLDADRLPPASSDLTPAALEAIWAGEVAAVNICHPRWRDALDFLRPRAGKKRVHLLAVGDVGGTLLTALKLIGGDVISSIGICDLNQNTVARWTAEMGQISWPWDYGALPEVEPVEPARLFDCDVFLFAATKSIPAVGSDVRDVRMAQFAANRPLVESFARQAREANFRGLFAVMSDPVDPLCKAAFLASNQDASGRWDGRGLLARADPGIRPGRHECPGGLVCQSRTPASPAF